MGQYYLHSITTDPHHKGGEAVKQIQKKHKKNGCITWPEKESLYIKKNWS
jgi:hypothetical protein